MLLLLLVLLLVAVPGAASRVRDLGFGRGVG